MLLNPHSNSTLCFVFPYSSLQNNYRKDVSLAINDIQSTKERIKNTASQITQAKYARELAATRFKNDVGRL